MPLVAREVRSREIASSLEPDMVSRSLFFLLFFSFFVRNLSSSSTDRFLSSLRAKKRGEEAFREREREGEGKKVCIESGFSRALQ